MECGRCRTNDVIIEDQSKRIEELEEAVPFGCKFHVKAREVLLPLFECDKCHAVECTSLGQCWRYAGKHNLCSECVTGTWHGAFAKETVAEGGFVYGDDGWLYKPKELEPGGHFHGRVKRADKAE